MQHSASAIGALFAAGLSATPSLAQCGSTLGPDLDPPTLAPGDSFGESVRTDGASAIVGAYAADLLGADAGRAWIWRWDGSAWIDRQELVVGSLDATDPNDHFGRSVDVAGEWALVGAYQDDDGGSNRGSAHFFRREASIWTWKQEVTASDGANTDRFGRALAIRGDIAAIGAPFDDDIGLDCGSAYVFRRDGSGTWIEEQKLLPTIDGGANDRFGKAFAVGENCVLVGSSLNSAAVFEGGAAYVWRYDALSSTWIEEARLQPPTPTPEERAGVAVALDGPAGSELAVVGAFDYDANPGDPLAGTGAAYVYRRVAGTWMYEGRLTSSDGVARDGFGWTVAVSGEVILVGSVFADHSGLVDAGAVYVFRRVGGVWTETRKIVSPSPIDADEQLGDSISIAGNRAIFGAHRWTDGKGRVVTGTIEDECVLAVCVADGSGATCPCANDVALGLVAGCRNSLGTGGALTSIGDASVASDTFVLHGAGMPNNSALYIQGTILASASFGDGLRCASGSVIRLGQKSNSGGASAYPTGGELQISLKGACSAGVVRIYQCWYRNSASFCTADTFNLTSALRVVWRP